MAAGDLKGEECIVEYVTAGAAVAKGDLVHLELDDGKWDPVAADDVGKFGVAVEAASADGVSFRVCLFGRVEVTVTAAAIFKGAYMEAGGAGIARVAVLTAYGEVCGFAYEAFGSSGTATMFVGVM